MQAMHGSNKLLCRVFVRAGALRQFCLHPRTCKGGGRQARPCSSALTESL